MVLARLSVGPRLSVETLTLSIIAGTHFAVLISRPHRFISPMAAIG
jgi:hypothetical protein